MGAIMQFAQTKGHAFGMFRWSKPKYLRIRNMPKHIPTL